MCRYRFVPCSLPPCRTACCRSSREHAGRYLQLQLLMATVDELCAAAQKGDCGKLRELLDGGGASVVNKRTELTDPETGEEVKTTALIQAVICGQHAAVELLLERKASPNLADSDDGTTPLMCAASGGRLGLRILQTLLDRKDIAINDTELEHDATAFHYACSKGNADCAVELARRGCDMTLRTKRGETGTEVAERMKRTAVLEGLRAHVLDARALHFAAQDGDCSICASCWTVAGRR